LAEEGGFRGLLETLGDPSRTRRQALETYIVLAGRHEPFKRVKTSRPHPSGDCLGSTCLALST
jgi:hypothetical protein